MPAADSNPGTRRRGSSDRHPGACAAAREFSSSKCSGSGQHARVIDRCVALEPTLIGRSQVCQDGGVQHVNFGVINDGRLVLARTPEPWRSRAWSSCASEMAHASRFSACACSVTANPTSRAASRKTARASSRPYTAGGVLPKPSSSLQIGSPASRMNGTCGCQPGRLHHPEPFEAGDGARPRRR